MHDTCVCEIDFVQLVFWKSWATVKAVIMTDGPSHKCNTLSSMLVQSFMLWMFILKFIRSAAKYCSLCPVGGKESLVFCIFLLEMDAVSQCLNCAII